MRRDLARSRRDRGAVLVEFAFVAALLTMLTLGAIDLGLLWQDRLVVQNATRAGVRVGSGQAVAAMTDYEILAAVRAGLADIGVANVDSVVVYKSVTTDGTVPVSCTTSSQNGSCNRYTGAQLAAIVPAQFGCGATALDRFWCPTSRQALLSAGPDSIGVYVKATMPRLIKVFGQTATVSDKAVMRIEPLT